MLSSPDQTFQTKMIAANRGEYGPLSDELRWVDGHRIVAAETRRARILQAAAPYLNITAKQTKPHLGDLSPGCRICSRGQWSCLFINGKCNCRCFYCPTAQNDISVPTTNRVPFATPAEYAQYVRRFGFSGVSISGGEPLLTFHRTIDYIETVRRELGTQLHIWLYTNGTMVTRERLNALKAAGLNEIRLDISAVDYDLSKAAMAVGIIECVTVEIPAIPEDFDRLTALLPEMTAAGIRHLNLHQLRLTPHNAANLIGRNYTFLHGESVTVLESELTALELIQNAAEKGLRLPINYCSFVYKRRYQQAATRRRNAGDYLKGWESVTENGFIRTLALDGPPETLMPAVRQLETQDPSRQRWTVNAKQDRLRFHESLWPLVDAGAGRLLISYSEAVLASNISYRCAFKEVRLDSGMKIFIEKRPVRLDVPVTEDERRFLEATILKIIPSCEAAGTSAPEEILPYECIQPGLQDYF